MKFQINVTKEVLERSKYCGIDPSKHLHPNGPTDIGSNCAIAVAIWDVIPNVCVSSTFVQFYPFYQDVRSPKKYVCCKYFNSYLPREASAFISKFDDTSLELRPLMEPLSFELDIPDEVIDSINIDEIKRRIEASPYKACELV